MNAITFLLALIFAGFGAFSVSVMLEHGYVGLWQAAFANTATMQVLFDLVITCLLISSWMLIDARKTGRNPWPYVLVTVAAGSFGPLLYLIVGRLTAPRRAALA